MTEAVQTPAFLETVLKIAGVAIPFIIAGALSRIVRKKMSHERVQGKLHLVVLKNFIELFIWMIAVAAAMSEVPGITRAWETLLAGSGIAAVVMGLAAQQTFGNIFAGIALTATKSRAFNIGDRVQIGDTDPGYVRDITLRHVRIETYYNTTIYIPNVLVGSSTISNYTETDGCSYPIEISIAYESDIEKAMKIMEETILSHPLHYGTGNAAVLCRQAGESGILLRGMVTTKEFRDNQRACSDCLAALIMSYKENGIEIPYNRLVILSGENAKAAEGSDGK